MANPPTPDEPEPLASVLSRLLLDLATPERRFLLGPKRQDEPDAERQQSHENGGCDDAHGQAASRPLVDAEKQARSAGGL